MNEQLALCDAVAWSIIGPGCTISGLFHYFPMPEVSCPVLDIRDCDPNLIESTCRRYHPSPDLEVDIDGLIPALLTIGAKPISLPRKAKDLLMGKPLHPDGTLAWFDSGSCGENSLNPKRGQP
jgi:hypothetical protein